MGHSGFVTKSGHERSRKLLLPTNKEKAERTCSASRPMSVRCQSDIDNRITRAVCGPLSAHGGDLGDVDPTLLRTCRVDYLRPTFFAPHNAEFGALCYHVDHSR